MTDTLARPANDAPLADDLDTTKPAPTTPDPDAPYGSKANPSQYECYHDLAADEPYFVIRARDPLSDALTELHAYIGAGQTGAAHNKLAEIMALTENTAPRPSGSPKYRETFAISLAMESWRAKNGASPLD